MPLTITFPDELATTLRTKADSFNQPVDQFTISFLDRAFNGTPHYAPIVEELKYEDDEDDELTLEELVAKIKATPPDPRAIHPPTESLLDILLNSPPEPEPDFDAEKWDQQWAQYEAEMKARSLADEMEERRF